MKWEENVRKVVPYVAGEQPNRPNMIKLNTNECPYPPAPGVRKAAENMESAALRLYPNSNAQPLVDELAAYYGVKPEQVFVGVGPMMYYHGISDIFQQRKADPVPGCDLFLL